MPILRGATACRADERLGPVGLVRLVSTDVRDVADVTAWLAPLPFQGMVFGVWQGEASPPIVTRVQPK